MEITFNTTQLDVSVALKAHKLYKAADYNGALPVLLDILDVEPNNWQARLFLGACYYKTGQKGAALRAFRHVYDNCKDATLKQKACLALQSVNAELNKFDVPGMQDAVAPPRIDHIIS